MRRVLVTGAATPLGRRLSARLGKSPGVERVARVDLAGRDHRSLVSLLREGAIDTVVHAALAAERSGVGREPSGGDVIATMRLCAAVTEPSLPVRALVLVSSSSVYPTRSYGPLLQRETGATETSETALAASLLEAEEYARDVAERAPHLCVAILRLAELAGPDVTGPLAALLAPRVVPVVLGFDPPVQWLHVEDAVRALAYAAEAELAGVYNLASEGVVRWSEAVRALRRRPVRMLPLEAGPFQPLLRGIGWPHVPNGLGGVLRFGRALDTSKLAAAGFVPKCDQAACLEALDRR
jgi:UDP-glucose 4-epimerase